MRPVLVVTGGSQGIGAAVARRAASCGYDVALTYARESAMAEAVAAEVEAAGGQAIAMRAEMASEADIVSVFEAVDARLGRLDALVTNAGITGPVGLIENVMSETIDSVMGINVRGVFLCLREAVRRMATDRGGRGGAIVNVSSRASGIGGGGEWVHYAASKGAIDSLTLGAAKEFATRGVRVNAVNPGLIETEIHARAGMPDRIERMKSGVPMGRAGSADEVARVVMWLLGEDASYVTGALVPVSGGR